MFNLNDILQSAQGGQAIENLAGQFGLSQQQTQQAVNALLPALSAGLKDSVGNGGALPQVLNQVNDPAHQAAFQDPNAAQSDEAQTAGAQAASQIVGGPGALSAIAQRAAAATGLPADLIEQMLPQVTSIALGGVASAMQSRGMGGLMGQLFQAAQAGGLGQFLPQSAGGASAEAPQAAPQSGGGGGFGGILGNIMGSLLGGGGGQQQQAPAQTSAPQGGFSFPGAGGQAGGLQGGLAQLSALFDHGTSADTNLEQDYAQIVNRK